MADYIVKDTELTSVANAIRTAGGTSSLLNFPNGFVSAVNNISGGGDSWQTVFEGSVTTEAQQIGEPTGIIEGVSSLTADSIKVTFNGTEYTCEKVKDGYGDFTFTQYPFLIDSWQGQVLLHTPSAGTYTIKIEVPQSGGSSDFSTATLTVTIPSGNETEISIPEVGVKALAVQLVTEYNSPFSAIVPLYKGVLMIDLHMIDGQVTIVGDGEYLSGTGRITITGDCTITISDSSSGPIK